MSMKYYFTELLTDTYDDSKLLQDDLDALPKLEWNMKNVIKPQ